MSHNKTADTGNVSTTLCNDRQTLNGPGKLGSKKGKNGMIIASINVYSLLPHLDEIELLLREKGIHFLSLNETKLDDTLSDNLFNYEF